MTVGSMLPFDRLIAAMDVWADEHPECLVVAQIGASRMRPPHMRWFEMLSPTTFRQHCTDADLVVSHAGMGTILTVTEMGKKLVILARSQALNEVTSDHQAATLRWLSNLAGIEVAQSESDLGAAIERARSRSGTAPLERGERQQLVNALRRFIAGGDPTHSLSRP